MALRRAGSPTKDARSAICGDHASECEQMFWLFLERGTRSPDASKIPVEEWRSRSSRGRYKHAMWTAAGLEEPRSRWEKQEGREPTWASRGGRSTRL